MRLIPIDGLTLRRVLIGILLDAGSPLTIAEVVAALHEAGVTPPPGKANEHGHRRHAGVSGTHWPRRESAPCNVRGSSSLNEQIDAASLPPLARPSSRADVDAN